MTKNKIAIFSLSIFLILGLASTSFASTINVKEKSIEKLLKPYEDVINKLNNELNNELESDPKMYIPNESKEKAYENIKHISPKEFERLLIDQYKEVKEYNKSGVRVYEDNGYIYQDVTNMEPESFEIPNFKGIIDMIPLD